MPANREFVRKFDRDRYLCTLFADRHDQEFLFTIYALYNELANIPFRIQEPKLGEIRLQWWRENLSELNTKKKSSNDPILQGLYALSNRRKFNIEFIMSIIDERETDLFKRQPETENDLIKYLDNTSVAISLSGLDVIGICDKKTRSAARDVALAYGLIGVLRSTSFLIDCNRLLLPKSLLDILNVSDLSLKNKELTVAIKATASVITEMADNFLLKARQAKLQIQKGSITCLLLASLTDLYIRRLRNLDYNLFDVRLSEPSYWGAWVLAFKASLKRF